MTNNPRNSNTEPGQDVPSESNPISLNDSISLAIKFCEENKSQQLLVLLKKGLSPSTYIPKYKYKNVCRCEVPLICVAIAFNSLDCVKLLIQAGAEIEAEDILSFLLESGSDPNPNSNASALVPLLYTAKFGYTKLVDCLLEFGVAVNQQDGSGRSALHLAAWFGYSALIQLLLKNKAIIDITDIENRTPLHFAAWFGHKDCCDILIKEGGLIDAQDHGGRTPLHFAVMHEHLDIVHLLLENNANTKLKTNNGKTAEAIAAAGNMTDIVELLQQKEHEEPQKEHEDEDEDEETPSRKDIMDEHQRMKAIITKIVESKDMQFEEYSALREIIDTHGMKINVFSQNQQDIMRQINQLHDLVYQILVTINIGLQQNDSSSSSATTSSNNLSNAKSTTINKNNNQQNSQNQQQLGQALTSSQQNFQTNPQQQQTPSQQMLSMRPIQPSSATSNGGVPLCRNCQNHEASFRCRQCHSPICSTCLPLIKQNGCPFCAQVQGSTV